ncbi:YggS family pyridoxal phosphate-dependent enzyme [Desulfuromonas thiophila]|uniref:Pyridoxal phosphate homeostasis protein n=1 Tax=Desulfuromonas thiophila TaxID=57664 RepID=A0A1G6ZM31_9BACT|nr:YggS family pyridoxal phosphate-dependent enzyme [Desulfuromonas thiophila]SDE03659.1 hypothetical protein SAMN05661003_10342 [Desulfuromonas thiophila]
MPPVPASAIATRLSAIRQRLEAACRRCGRAPESVQLIAVSKKQPVAAMAAAAAAGQQLFGESYVQEFIDKQQQLDLPLEWHFIGALQSNKVKYLRGRTALIHSVDRWSLAQEIDRQWGRIGQRARILLQVNLAGETSKAGVAPDQLSELASQISTLAHVRLEGLMCLPPYAADPEQVRPWFRQLRQLAATLQLEVLSMGMSHDFEVAIEEGATLIRVGTALFGERD